MTECIGDATRAFAKVARDVVLSKLAARAEENDGLLFAELMVEQARKARV